MNRATPKTREWAMNSMQAFIAYEEYSLNVLKKIIAKKVIELCLNNTELTKKVIPEIFCWDLAFIKKIQKKCIRAIHIHRIIDQTNLYFQKYNISNVNLNWNDISHDDLSTQQIIALVSKKAQLTPIETYQYEAHILESTADEKEDEISNIKQLLFKFSVGSIYPIENDSVFPVCDLYILINHLAITHKGTLKHYYEQINNNFLIELVFNDSLAIPTTPKFESVNQKIRQSRYWINKICEALAAMRMTRHHMISQKTLLSDETSIMAILNTIPLRLAPLFKSFFSVQSYQQPNQKTEKNFHTNLNVIIQQFINDIFSEYKNLFFSQLFTMLKSNNVPQKNKYNYLLHPFWNDFCEFPCISDIITR